MTHHPTPTGTNSQAGVRGGIAVLALLSACACGDSGGETRPGATTRQIDSGVRGRTIVDAGWPPLPTTTTATPFHPLSARITVTRVGSPDPVTTAVSDAHGNFRIPLPPGHYVLKSDPTTEAPAPTALPVAVTVPTHEYADVTIKFDSGVRGPGGP
jgi:hypothetical protein